MLKTFLSVSMYIHTNPFSFMCQIISGCKRSGLVQSELYLTPYEGLYVCIVVLVLLDLHKSSGGNTIVPFLTTGLGLGS